MLFFITPKNSIIALENYICVKDEITKYLSTKSRILGINKQEKDKNSVPIRLYNQKCFDLTS